MASPYPPPHHVLRDLGPTVHVRGDEARGGLAVRPELCGPSGGVLMGPVAILVDMLGGGLAARAAYPDWIATADLTVHLTARPATGSIEAVGRVLRAGRTTVVMEVALGHGGAPIGVASMSFAVLPRREGNPDIAAAQDSSDEGDAPPWLAGGDLARPLADALEIRTFDARAGVLEAPVIDYSRNSLDALQGGVVATLACLAADAALSDACDRSVETADLHLTYLALNKLGPVRTRTEVLRASAEEGTARVETVDAAGRLTAVAGIVAVAGVVP
ncbi:MAG: PaaI family thioesterase [Acidimicrobiia bacterium]